MENIVLQPKVSCFHLLNCLMNVVINFKKP